MSDKKTLFEKIDSGCYRDLNKPFESAAVAQKAVTDFCDELYELRKKHGIPDVYFICRILIADQSDESATLVKCHYGDPMLSETLTAWAFGQEQSERQMRIGKLIAAFAVTKPQSKR